MFIGSCRIEIFIPTVHSLKEKRSVVKSVVARLRNEFNASVAEVDALDVWQRGVIGVACVSSDSRYVQEQMQAIVDWVVEHRPDVQLIDAEMEIL